MSPPVNFDAGPVVATAAVDALANVVAVDTALDATALPAVVDGAAVAGAWATVAAAATVVGGDVVASIAFDALVLEHPASRHDTNRATETPPRVRICRSYHTGLALLGSQRIRPSAG